MTLNELKDLISQFGLTGTITSFIVILLWSIGKTEWFTKFVDRIIDNIFKKEKKTNDVSKNDILNHDMFNYVDYWIVSRVPALEFSTEYRTVVFKRYLTIFLESYKKVTKDYITSGKYEKMGESELWKSVFELFNNIVSDYETSMIKENIPMVVVEKMRSKNNDMIVLIIDLAEGICNSSFYNSENNSLKIYSILNIILSVLEGTLSNVNNVCNSINGQLKGMKYTFNGKEYVE